MVHSGEFIPSSFSLLTDLENVMNSMLESITEPYIKELIIEGPSNP